MKFQCINGVGRICFFLFFCLLFIDLSFSAPNDIAFNNQQLANQIPSISIQSDSRGHYRGMLLINNVRMPFLIDTGATEVAVPRNLAYAARLPLGKAFQSSTANGLALARSTRIDSLKIGNVELRGLKAHTLDHLDVVLLGMSALNYFYITQDHGVLTLSLYPELTVISPLISVPAPDESLIKQKSLEAYSRVQSQVDSFKAQYVKPAECHDMHDRATRMHCANAFIKARQAYDALNK